MRSPPIFLACVAATLALSMAPSLANRTAADACAARLPADAKLIYTATIGSVVPGVDFADNVRSKARELVMAGKLTRDQAQPAAQAAGACLKQAM